MNTQDKPITPRLKLAGDILGGLICYSIAAGMFLLAWYFEDFRLVGIPIGILQTFVAIAYTFSPGVRELLGRCNLAYRPEDGED